jgi:hypothetical protein
MRGNVDAFLALPLTDRAKERMRARNAARICHEDLPDWPAHRRRALAPGFPHRRDVHLPGQPLARRDAAQDGRLPAGFRATLGRRAACGRGTKAGGEIGRETGNLLAPILGVEKTPSRCTRT